ncbi:amidase [Aquihabitans sp. McL0605]|uniref:amidase n=1 Tax=Aquihabitans sp. McL0605 TaxID=3415671 RepID=UPI003CEE5FDE
MDFRRSDIEDLARQVREREVSARELTAHALNRIDATNDEVGAFVAIDGESALLQAADIDACIAAGEDVGPLAGIPIGVKDTEDAEGFRTTQGSLLFADRAVATSDSVLVARLRQAGCVIIGKTNTPELAWKADTDNRVFGRTGNPWALDRSAGGSSGGSSAAVAAGMVPMATGSDGGGSLRIPGALCGLTTMKPSLGRVPAGGPRPPGWADLSSKGLLVGTARDSAYALDAVIGPEPTDLRSLPMPDESWRDAVENLHAPRRVIWSPTLGYAVLDPEIRAVCERAVSALEARGTEVLVMDDVFDEDPALPWLMLSLTANLRVVQAAVDGDGDGPGWDDLDPGLASMLTWARNTAGPTTALESSDVAHHLNLRLVDLFHEAPLLLTPTVAGHTPVGSAAGLVNGIEDISWVRYTYPFNLTRSPAGTVCAGFTGDGMPVGLQVVGPQHADVAVLRMLALIEETVGVDHACPYEPSLSSDE